MPFDWHRPRPYLTIWRAIIHGALIGGALILYGWHMGWGG